MKNNYFEISIGAVVLIIACLFVFFTSKIYNNKKNISNGYYILAEFSNIEGLNIGNDVKIAGVKIGNIENISLNKKNYKAIVLLSLRKDYNVPIDSIFKISSSGLLGGKFINIKIGSDDEYFKNNDFAEFTESTMDLEDLISRFIFNQGEKNAK